MEGARYRRLRRTCVAILAEPDTAGRRPSFRGMSATDSENAQNSGRIPIGISGRVPSEWVADLRRNQWPGWVGIRSRHQIGCPEPLSEREMGAVHGCARCGRGLVPTCSTQKQRPCCEAGARLTGALWANTALWPSASNEILRARFLSRKLLAKRSDVPGILRSPHNRIMATSSC